jgi:thioredoxin-like negative regulator of GroEL
VTRALAVALALTAAVSLGAEAPSSAPAARPRPTKIRWEKNFTAALERARAEKKPVMIDFWAEWCGWCHKLDAVTYKNREVVALAQDFVAVKVDTEGRRAEQKIAADYGVESLPTIVFVSPHGRAITRVSGYEPPARFVASLGRVREAANEMLALETAAAANDTVALAQLGTRMFEAESYEDSRDLLTRAAATDAERPAKDRKRTRTLLGIIHHFDNKPVEAERVLKEALGLKPADADEDAAAMLTLGKAYLKWGKTTEARSTLQKVVDAYPQSRSAVRAREALLVVPQ